MSAGARACVTVRDFIQLGPRPPGDWDDLVVICAGTSWDGVWFPEKHVADRLARLAPVLYVDPPLSFLAPWRQPDLTESLRGPRLRLIRPGLARLTPIVPPGMHRLGVPEVDDVVVRQLLRRAVARLTDRVHAVIVAAPTVPFDACGERLKVLYATDDFVAGAALMGLSKRQLLRRQRRQARQANMVVAVSPLLVEKWRELGQRTALIPNGCDADMFASTDDVDLAPDVALPSPIAGFIGHLSDRIDIALLEAVAQRGCSLLLVGPRQGTFEIRRMEQLLARANVQWVGSKPFESLPSYMRAIDVGLTPYADTTFNRASFPLKTLEYLAGGRAAVASDLPAARWLDTDLIVTTSGPDAFGDAVHAALAVPRTETAVRRRREFARLHSWEARTNDIARLLGLAGCYRP